MKLKLLFGVLIASSFTSFSQKKLISYTSKGYNEGGSISYIDSNHYSYATWQGALNSNEPMFTANINNPIYQNMYELPEINYTDVFKFGGSSYPLTPSYNGHRSYNVFYQVTQDTNSFSKEIYTYNFSTGNLSQIEFQYFDGMAWQTSSVQSYAYDASNRLIEERRQDDLGSGLVLTGIDSVYYQGATNLINKGVSYSSNDGVTFTQEIYVTTQFSGNNPSQLDFYINGDFTYRGVYTYAAGMVDSLKVYPVVLNVPQTTMIGSFNYDYNASNKLATETTDGLEERITSYSYDADGFLTQIQDQELDSNGVAYYVSYVRNFTYQNVAGIEANTIEVSLYPNPVQSNLTINTSEEIESVLIYDMKGNLVIKQSKLATVDVSNLMAGTYKIVAITQSGQAVSNFIKN